MEEKNENREIAIQISGVKKRYKLGQIGGATLKEDLQSWWARVRGKEDPNTVIGQDQRLVGKSFMALNGIDLTIYKGEALGIIGANGAGKSTLLKLLSRVTAPTEGEIDIYGRVTSMLEVGTGFSREMTGRENVYMNGAILGMTKAEIDAKMEKIIDFSEVRDFIDTPVKRYSSGMYVKLAFSVAAHLDSEIMIMDEVLAVGDVAFQTKCLTKMREAANKEGRTVLYVSHNMNTIRQLCTRCVVLNQGRVVFVGDVEDAIAVYIGTRYDDDCYYNYETREELRFSGGKDFRVISAEYIRKNNRFSAKDKLPIRIRWQYLKDVQNLSLRIEIREQDRTAIGTAFIYNFTTGKKGKYEEAEFLLDISSLSFGKYASTYTFFEVGSYGANVNLDNVRGLGFEIIHDDKDIYWDRKHWGVVRFPEIELR